MPKSIIQSDVYNVVREQIITWSRKPGEPLKEETLAREFQVSRTPLREVLRKLVEDGLATYEPHRGARVALPTIDLVRDVFLAREALEGIAAREAAARFTGESLIRMRDRLEGLRGLVANGDSRDVGDEIHDLILEAGGSERLRHMLEVNMGQVRWAQYLAAQSPQRLVRSFREHDCILCALEARDAIAAETAARSHVRSVLAYLMECMPAVTADGLPKNAPRLSIVGGHSENNGVENH